MNVEAARLWELHRWIRSYVKRAVDWRLRDAKFQPLQDSCIAAKQFDRVAALDSAQRLSALEISELNRAPERFREYRTLLGPRLERMQRVRTGWRGTLKARAQASLPDSVPSESPVRYELPDLDVINSSPGYSHAEAIRATRRAVAQRPDREQSLAAMAYQLKDLKAFHAALQRAIRQHGLDPDALLATHNAALEVYRRDNGLVETFNTARAPALVDAQIAYETLFRALDRASPMLAYRFFLATDSIREAARREGLSRTQFRSRLAALGYVESRGSRPGRPSYSPAVVRELTAELAALPVLARPLPRSRKEAADIASKIYEDVAAVACDWEVFLPYWFLHVLEDRPDPREPDPQIDAERLTKQHIQRALEEVEASHSHAVRGEVYRRRDGPRALAWQIAARLFYQDGAETLRRAAATVAPDRQRLLFAMRRAWRGS